MELVRQMFAEGVLASAFWHRFVLTRHSGIFPNPAGFGVEILGSGKAHFAQNDVAHADPTGGNHDAFDDVLPVALAAWMRGEELNRPVHTWFSGPKTPKTRERSTRIREALAAPPEPDGGRVVWLGGEPLQDDSGLRIFGTKGELRIEADTETVRVIGELLVATRPDQPAVKWQVAQSHLGPAARAWVPLLREGGLICV